MCQQSVNFAACNAGSYENGCVCVSARTNIALKKHALQSTLHRAFYAAHAVDGKLSTFSHTTFTDSLKWLRVDLGEIMAIGKIIVWNRVGELIIYSCMRLVGEIQLIMF